MVHNDLLEIFIIWNVLLNNFSNNSWPVYCSEAQPKTHVAKTQFPSKHGSSSSNPVFGASAENVPTWNWLPENPPQCSSLIQQRECCLQGACSAGWRAAWTGFIQLLSLLLSTTKQHRLPQVTSSLIVKCCTYDVHSQPSGSLKEITLMLKAPTVLVSFPCSIDAGSSERSASAVLEWRDENKRLHLYVMIGLDDLKGLLQLNWFYDSIFSHVFFRQQCQPGCECCLYMDEGSHTLGSKGLGFQEFEIWQAQQVLCPVPHLQAAGLAVPLCSPQGNSHFQASVPAIDPAVNEMLKGRSLDKPTLCITSFQLISAP